MSKIALISFHKNLDRYPNQWITDYRDSILSQTYKEFDVFEMDYGGGDGEWIFQDSDKDMFSFPGITHADAHMILVKKCIALGYDLVLNTNVDDIYPSRRVELQAESYNPDIAVSSGNYLLFEGSIQNIRGSAIFAQHGQPHPDLAGNFARGNNIIAHPACAYTRKFVEYCDLNCDGLRTSEIPTDDFRLWQRMLAAGERFNILPEVLLFYRYHQNKAS
jgi:hypothetical protein